MWFAQPGRLWLLAFAGAIAVAHVVVQARRAGYQRRFASSELFPLLVDQRGRAWWRHALALLLVAVIALMAVGAAEPTVAAQVERKVATIIVAIDVSDSMGATDVRPDRITAAVRAATEFVGDLPPTFDVGLVTAGATPTIVVSPTADHEAVQRAMHDLTLSPGTALGEAIFASLAALPKTDAPADPEHPAAHIVLLSDGVTTTGRPDEEAVDAAVDAGVPVSTIAFGTDDASVVSQGQVVDVPVDARALRAIADGTGGEFFEAASAAELRRVYADIDAGVTVEQTDRSLAPWFAAGAFALLFLAVLLSMVTTARAAWV